MIADIIELAKDYGIGAALAAIIFPWLYSVDRRSRKTKHDIESVHLKCHIPMGAVEEMKQEIVELEKVDHDLETRFAVMESELKEIKSDVKAVLMHLTLKGIDGK